MEFGEWLTSISRPPLDVRKLLCCTYKDPELELLLLLAGYYFGVPDEIADPSADATLPFAWQEEDVITKFDPFRV